MGMWLAIGCAAGVLVAAAYAALGHFGEMPARAVLDRPRGRVPAGPVTAGFLLQAQLPVAGSGYARGQVDAYLRQIAEHTAGPASQARFEVTRNGYDMQVIDELLRRPRLDDEPASGTELPGSTLL